MSIAGQFLRDLFGGTAGDENGACCNRPQGGGTYEYDCFRRTRGVCAEIPHSIFYAGAFCQDIDCSLQACCQVVDGAEECSMRFESVIPHPDFPSGCPGGEFKGVGSWCGSIPAPCEPPPEPEPDERPSGCIKESTQERRERTGGRPKPPGGFTWNTDLCQNAQFRMTIRPPSMWPSDQATRNVTSLNYAEMISIGAIRANDGGPGVEPCRDHFAKLVQGNDGYARMMMCGQHVAADPDTLQVSEGRFYMENDSIRPKPVSADQRIDNGYAAVAVGYRAPYWVEGIFHASQVYCGGIR